ncbi:hypothetical protein CA13_38310 [Planctomycetes bacterium CA13]|uniref:Regulator of ribonuclease activity B domain-containing protein n=1 Tax=Novipirellula herctigrandis TaxID=2527986 RepID=A0A5C5Z4Q6_9BACT|nr:hypothetical protein CA13_38310 [Planctomycetes bacterium CA13]
MTIYPDDADGNVLTDLAGRGVDMSQPLDFEFPVVAPDQEAANAIAKALFVAGYDTHIEHDEGEPNEEGEIDPDDEEFGPCWDVFANIRMVPDYDEIMRIQEVLNNIADPFGGKSDGWGVMLDADPEHDPEQEIK